MISPIGNLIEEVAGDMDIFQYSLGISTGSSFGCSITGS